jgi:putative holliday junction resolvase
MRYLGIDYGTKRVGIAISDEAGEFAFPKAVFPNNNFLLSEIKKLIQAQKITTVVIGESKDFKMKDNPIMKNITQFIEFLKQDTRVTVQLESEFLSSHQAQHIQGMVEKIDASAAAIILQSFLDKQKKV